MIKYQSSNINSLSQLTLDRGLHYGDGLFETIAIHSGIAQLLNEHITRLSESCLRLKIEGVDFLKIQKEIEQQAKITDEGVLKLIVTRGSGGRGYSTPDIVNASYMILQYPLPNYNRKFWNKGVAIKKCELVLANQPLLAGMKHLNRLENVMAKMEIENSEYQEGILCDSTQNIIEATSSNVFIVLNNNVFTPKLDKCGVSGVMRDEVIKKLHENRINIEVLNIPFEDILNADEIFLTNSVIGIWPVAKFNERMYSNFPIARMLMTSLKINYDV